MGNWYDFFLLSRLFSYRAVGAGTYGWHDDTYGTYDHII